MLSNKRLNKNLSNDFLQSIPIALSTREIAASIMSDWSKPRPLTLFLEFHFPFVSKKVQKILMERHPQFASKRTTLKKNPCYPIHAYLIAEEICWASCLNPKSPGKKNILGSLWPQLEILEWFFRNDLKWFSTLLSAIAEAFEKLMTATPKHKWEDFLQAWCRERDQLKSNASGWLEGTIEGISKLDDVKRSNMESFKINPTRIPPIAAQINAKRRKIFMGWEPCWQAELEGLDIQIKKRFLVRLGVNKKT